MKILTKSIAVGSLMMIGALPAAGQSPVALGSGATILFAAASDSSVDRETYLQQARDDMLVWRQKLNDFSKKAEAKGKEEDKAAKNDLSKAWDKTEAASQKLQTAGTEDWESARTSYEKASKDLASAWDKFRRNNT